MLLVIQPKIIAYQLNVPNRPKQTLIILGKKKFNLIIQINFLEFLELKYNIPNKIVIILTQKNLHIFLISVITLIFIMFTFFEDKIKNLL